MAKKITTYTVTILAWSKHNGGKKRGHTHLLLSSRFTDDEKIIRLPIKYRMLYLWLLCRCADEVRETIKFTPSLIRVFTELRPSLVHDAIRSLESNQLLRVEKIDGLIEEKRREEKRTPPNPPGEGQADKPPSQASPEPKPAELPRSQTQLHRIAQLWNQEAPKGFGRVKEMNRVRQRLCKLQEHRSDAEITFAIRDLTGSAHHRGSNERGWKADFDWFLKPEHFTKAVEGGYSSSKSKPLIDWGEDART